MKRRFLTVILLLCFLLSLMLPAHGYDEQQVAADTLHGLGLFKGVGTKDDGTPDYALERSLSRQEAVTMLVRLLGAEEEAKNGSWYLPFTDVDNWAIPYVGYAYANGLTNGISDTAFGGSQSVTAAQYLTFVLRALGYVSGEDFVWSAAWEKTDFLGITSGQYSAENNGTFLRGDAVSVSSNALSTTKKEDPSTLLEQLVAEGAVTQEAAEKSGLLPDEYVLFAREIIAAGKDPVTVSLDANDMMGRTALAPIFQEYDGYPGSAATLEKAMVRALQEYMTECYDGDYSDGYVGTPTFRNWGDKVDAFVLTDTKGSVIAYGVRTDQTSKDFTLYFCKLNSKNFVKDALQAKADLIQSLEEVSVQGVEQDGQYVYSVDGLPEEAAFCSVILGTSTVGTLKKPVKIETVMDITLAGLSRGWLELLPAQTEFSEPSEYMHQQSGEDWRFVVFWDAGMQPVGYSLVCIKITR